MWTEFILQTCILRAARAHILITNCTGCATTFPPLHLRHFYYVLLRVIDNMNVPTSMKMFLHMVHKSDLLLHIESQLSAIEVRDSLIIHSSAE